MAAAPHRRKERPHGETRSRLPRRPPRPLRGAWLFGGDPLRRSSLRFRPGWAAAPTARPEPDFERQVRLAFANLEATLAAAGCTFDDIVDVTTFHTDPENQFPAIMKVKQEIFGAPPYPTWTAVGVTWLAGFDFEIKVIARLPA